MSLSPDQVRSVAKLARLAIDDADVSRYAGEMSQIMDLVDRLGKADATDVVPMAHPLDLTQRLRTDVVTESDQREALQTGAPQVEDGCYLVPRVIE